MKYFNYFVLPIFFKATPKGEPCPFEKVFTLLIITAFFSIVESFLIYFSSFFWIVFNFCIISFLISLFSSFFKKLPNLFIGFRKHKRKLFMNISYYLIPPDYCLNFFRYFYYLY